MKLRTTRPVAWLALLAVFFAQLATAAYACPLIEAALKVPVASTEQPTPCAEMGMDAPETASALCLEHCKAGQQLVDNQSPVSPVAAELVPLVVVAALAAPLSARTAAIEPLLARAAAPSVFASSSRLRI